MAAGAGHLFSERVSEAKAERPELEKMPEQLRGGDVVTPNYDHFARSGRDLLDIVEAIKERGAGFRSLAEVAAEHVPHSVRGCVKC